ncbi:hypothetical protein BOTBODRAFT_191824 [Botryobasidium botryosum FD-172 SS1]|uniref:F-box domain-containing protein n=1 Tax=Botryobasidium botryosum (strain FD-172 SS1) TaxID=930990 RepID=A0A067M926_BOTB1|nr:hypothetical protein BOTBODRAFT_191824 [Botryobasidium botryosum FD-172 SS1]
MAVDTWEKTLEFLVSLDTFVQAVDAPYDIKRRDNGGISTPAGGVPEHAATEDTYSRISEAYINLGGFEANLELARIKIQNIRNQSPVLIHHLPDEILSAIFILGSQDRVRDVGFDALIGEGAADHDDATVHGVDVPDVESEESGDSNGDEAGEESGSDPASREVTKGKAPPFNLLVSQVCHRWREVALNTGQLWTRIDLTKPPPHERIKLWLERSRNHPLDAFYDTRLPAMSSESLALTLLTVLEHFRSSVSQCAELRCINLTIDTSRSFKNIRLILLELSYTFGCISEMLRGVTALHLHEFCFPWDHPVYTKLVEFALISDSSDTAPTAPQFGAILLGCPLLENIKLEGIGYDFRSTASPITMTSLHTISVRDLTFGSLAFIFNTIRAPRLRRFYLHDMCSNEVDYTSFEATVSGLLASAGRSLRYLSVSDRDTAILYPSLITFLQKAPCITSLELRDAPEPQAILHALTHESICPEFQSLIVTRCEDKRGIAN